MTLNLHYKKQGTGPPLILMHGLFGSISNLQSIARHLSKCYTVYSIDHRNHGRSPHHSVMDYHCMADDILNFMNQHDINKPILIGHSMGGKVGMMVSLLKAERVQKLVVLDIAPVAYSHSYDSIFTAMNSINLALLASRHQADEVLQQFFQNTGFRQFLLQNLIHKDMAYHWRLNLSVIIDNIDSIVGWPDMGNRQFPNDTLFIGGTASDFIKTCYHEKLFQFFPNARIDMLDGASHWLHAEQTEKTLEHIEQFLQH